MFLAADCNKALVKLNPYVTINELVPIIKSKFFQQTQINIDQIEH